MESIFTEILIVSCVATLVVTACHAIKLPSIVGFILTGLAIGPSGGGLVSSLPSAYTLTELAGIILMFTIGLECSFSKLQELKLTFLRLGIPQVVLTVLVIFGGGLFFTSFGYGKMLLWAFAISLSSTALVLKLLHDYGDFNSPHGHNSLGILLFQDLAVIPMVLVLPLLVSSHAGATSLSSHTAVEALVWSLKISGVVLGLFFVARYGLSRLLELVVRTKNKELFFFSIIFVCLGTGYIFHSIGLSLSLGAFIAGVIISESAFGHHTVATFGSLRDTFLGLFFVTVGMLLDLNFVWQNFSFVLLLGLLLFIVKTSIVTMICWFQRIPFATALITGLTVCQVGEFSFLLVSSGMKLGIFSETDNQYFLAVSVLSMIISPFIYAFAPKLVHSQMRLQWSGGGFDQDAREISREISRDRVMQTDPTQIGSEEPQHKPTLIIGFGIAGRNVAEALGALKIPCKVLEMNYETVKKQSALGVNISFGDATKPDALRHAGIADAHMVVIAASGADSASHIVHAIRTISPSIPIVLRAQYMRDLKKIPKEPWLRPVVAEIETASELVAHVLKNYGVSPRTIFEYTAKVRTQLNSVAEAVSGTRYADLELPSWEVLSSLRPVALRQADFAVGKSLTQIGLPQIARVSIVSIYRKNQGTFVPDGNIVLQHDDIIHLIGAVKDLSVAESFLTRGLLI